MSIRNKLLQDIVVAEGGTVSGPITRNSLLQDWLDAVLSSPSFSPLDLFALGEQGVWYDPSDLSTLFQDSAGTTPVTADGDPVGLMQDKSGNGNDASQTISANRPTYKTDGTLHWLEFDGVDDSLTSVNLDFSGSSYGFMASGISIDSSGTQGFFGIEGAGGDNLVTLRVDGDRTIVRTSNNAGDALSVSDDFTANSVVRVIVDKSAGDTTTYKNGVDIGGGSLPTSTWFVDPIRIEIGSNRASGDTEVAGNFFGGIITDSDPTASYSDIDDYMADKSGVTL